MSMAERIPEKKFEAVFRPLVRALGTRNFILRLNAGARTAIPRQTRLKELMPKLKLLCYGRRRPGVDAELERLFDDYLEQMLDEHDEDFYRLTDKLNQKLAGESLPAEPEARREIVDILVEIRQLLAGLEMDAVTIEAVFRIKAYPEVLNLYLEQVAERE